jgi:hypothetical protein
VKWLCPMRNKLESANSPTLPLRPYRTSIG